MVGEEVTLLDSATVVGRGNALLPNLAVGGSI
jgi:hypothetical protein